MKTLRLSITVVCFILCSGFSNWAQDIDTELTALAKQLAGKVQEQGKKRVAILDFTDLQGTTSGELGKYVAEQLTVDLVMEKHDFSVLDRANLKKILAEHKLTATGLIDPENAKKLGQFAGVDALILGTVVPKSGTVGVTAKIITTDTAEIVGAAKASFKSDETVQQLISKPSTGDADASSDKPATPEPNKKLFGDLQARIESIVLLPNGGNMGFARLTMVITNTSETTTFGVAVNTDVYQKFILANDRGDEFRTIDVDGIERGFEGYTGFQGSMTDIPPRSAIKIVSKSQTIWNGTPGEYRPFHFHTEIFFSPVSQGRHTEFSKYNLVLDVK